MNRKKLSFKDWQVLMKGIFFERYDEESFDITSRLLYLYCFNENFSDEVCEEVIEKQLNHWKKIITFKEEQKND